MAPADPPAVPLFDPLADLSVELFWSPVHGECREQRLTLPAGSRLRDALAASDWFEPDQIATLTTGIWGRVAPLETPLREQDRVEVYRPLTVDPKEARRQRFQAAGSRIVTRHRPLGRKA